MAHTPRHRPMYGGRLKSERELDIERGMEEQWNFPEPKIFPVPPTAEQWKIYDESGQSSAYPSTAAARGNLFPDSRYVPPTAEQWKIYDESGQSSAYPSTAAARGNLFPDSRYLGSQTLSDEELQIAQQMGEDVGGPPNLFPSTVQVPEVDKPFNLPELAKRGAAETVSDIPFETFQPVASVEDLMKLGDEEPTGNLEYDEFTKVIRSAMEDGRLEDAILALEARDRAFPEGVMADVKQELDEKLARQITLLAEQDKHESARIFQNAANNLRALALQGELTVDQIKVQAEVMMAQIMAKGEMDAETAAQVHIYKLEYMESEGLLTKDKIILEYDLTLKNMAARGLLDATSQSALYAHQMTMLERRGELDAGTVITLHANAMALQGSVNDNNVEIAKINAKAALDQLQLQGDLSALTAANLQESIMAQLKWISDSDIAVAKEITARELALAEKEGNFDIELAEKNIAGRLADLQAKHAHEIALEKLKHDNKIREQEALGVLNADAASRAFGETIYLMNRQFELTKQLEEIRRRSGTSPFRAASSFFKPLEQRVEV
jgi:hypothetical protein